MVHVSPSATPPRPPWQGSDRKQELPANWEEIRAAVLEDDDRQCRIRYPGICAGEATDVDHIRRGNDHQRGNLQAACRACHRRKSGQEGAAARVPLRRPPEPHPAFD